MLGRRAAILEQLEPTTIASLSIHLPAGVRYSRCLRPRKGITSGYLDHEQQSAVGSRAPGPELEGMIRGGGGGGAGAAAAVAHQLMQNPLVGAIVLLVLVAAAWWVWNKYF